MTRGSLIPSHSLENWPWKRSSDWQLCTNWLAEFEKFVDFSKYKRLRYKIFQFFVMQFLKTINKLEIHNYKQSGTTSIVGITCYIRDFGKFICIILFWIQSLRLWLWSFLLPPQIPLSYKKVRELNYFLRLDK
jgi:hypothetical protein